MKDLNNGIIYCDVQNCNNALLFVVESLIKSDIQSSEDVISKAEKDGWLFSPQRYEWTLDFCHKHNYQRE